MRGSWERVGRRTGGTIETRLGLREDDLGALNERQLVRTIQIADLSYDVTWFGCLRLEAVRRSSEAALRAIRTAS
jgi:hypothetical protein